MKVTVTERHGFTNHFVEQDGKAPITISYWNDGKPHLVTIGTDTDFHGTEKWLAGQTGDFLNAYYKEINTEFVKMSWTFQMADDPMGTKSKKFIRTLQAIAWKSGVTAIQLNVESGEVQS